ncbi:MAG: GNAT family N-acetyltransferase [Chloroflexi bacterium]|nr:GNAT family N-acetyltransferase [Chloroflexota bacterium]
MVQLQGARVVLRDKKLEDAEQDYIWRSDPELARLDAAYPLTMTFDRFLKIFEDQLKYPTPGSHHFATETLDGKFIGNCMYYDLDSVNMEAELGIVLGDRDYWGNAYGYDAVTTLLEYMFTEKKLRRVYLHTLEWNKRAHGCFAKCGFVPVRPVRRLSHDFILMEVYREDWLEKAEQRLADRHVIRDKVSGGPAPAGASPAEPESNPAG